MSSTPNNPNSTTPSTTTTTTTANTAPENKLEQLPILQEDDEFEEFAKQDWDQSETFAAQSTKVKAENGTTANSQPGAALDNLWQDNWDDDDVDDDFSVALRSGVARSDGRDSLATAQVPRKARFDSIEAARVESPKL